MYKLIRNLLLGMVVALPPLFAVGALTATSKTAEADGRYYRYDRGYRRSYRPYYRYNYRPYYYRPYYGRYYGTPRYYYDGGYRSGLRVGPLRFYWR